MVAPISIEEKDFANQHLDHSISLILTGKSDQASEKAKKSINFLKIKNELGM